jgi:aminomethyltransferase
MTAVGLKKTALHDRHRALGAKMTDFHGWDMPLYYTSILEEHRAVRDALGLFDVSHMGQVLVTGPDAEATLNQLVVSDITQVGILRACYTMMLNDQGGILDDLIIYRLGAEEFLVIVNCGTHDSDVAWLKARRLSRTTVTDVSEGRSILAVQGPLAARVLEHLLDAKVAGLGRFAIAPMRTMSADAGIARTGYTGGDGFELFLPDQHARRVWDSVLSQGASVGARPVGLGARDTLRIEAGLRLYGTDMDTSTTPWEAGLDWTVALNKPGFIGQEALRRQKQQGLSRHLVGFELTQGPVPRTGMPLYVADHPEPVGQVTSGTYSPILAKSLGMGYVQAAHARVGSTLTLLVRNLKHTATIVKMPFWRPGVAHPTLANPPSGQRSIESA